MIATIIISALTCLGIVVTTLAKPNIKIKKYTLNFYWVIALTGALVLLCSNLVGLDEFWNGLTSNSGINPIQILILFLSMTMISIFLDELGFFARIASFVLKHTKTNQYLVFIAFYFLVAILTMFTSNDIIILTLTPFIIFFCKNAKISPIPYLVSEFVAANTWSMMFIIGNPTNIYLATSFDINFVEYFKVMAVPTLVCGLAEFGLLLLLFHKKLKDPIQHVQEILPNQDKVLTVIGLSILIICTVFLILSSYIDLPMYLISLISLITLSFAAFIYALIRKRKPKEILHTYLRAPWELVPFVIGMFTIALALKKYEVTSNIANLLGDNYSIWKYGFASFLSANLLNNIPMSVMYSSIIDAAKGIDSLSLCTPQAIYASIIGSNIGAFLTPIGALAGIMWMGILKDHEVKFNFLDFVKYGAIISIPVISIALAILQIFA